MRAGRRSLVTVVPMVVGAAVSTLALAAPAVMGLLTRDRGAVQAGQWWRTVTPILVQPSGFPALVFLLAGLAAVAPPLVVRFGARPAVAGMVLAGLVPLVWSTWLDPGDRGGGSSDVVAGLVGMWAVASLGGGSGADRSWRTVLAGGYGAFFAGYLATLASPLAVLAPLVGNAAAGVAIVAHRRFGRPDVAGGLIMGGGLVMTALLNDHGFGIVVGAAVALVAAARPSPVGRSGMGIAGRVPMFVAAAAGVVVMWTSAYGVELLSWSAAPAALVAVALLLLAGPATAEVGPRYRAEMGG